MIRYAKQTIFGSYKEIRKEKNAPYVVMEIEQYLEEKETEEKTKTELSQCMDKIREKSKQFPKDKEKIKDKAADEWHKIYENFRWKSRETDQKCDSIRDKIKEKEIILSKKIALNEHLKRISKEHNKRKAMNEISGIEKENPDNKEEETLGYSVIVSGEVKERIQDPGTGRNIQVVVWRTTIKTPYGKSVSIDDADYMIYGDLEKTILPMIGIHNIQLYDENGCFKEWFNDNGRQVDGVFRWLVNLNTRKTHYDVSIFHVFPIMVPESLRPVRH